MGQEIFEKIRQMPWPLIDGETPLGSPLEELRVPVPEPSRYREEPQGGREELSSRVIVINLW